MKHNHALAHPKRKSITDILQERRDARMVVSDRASLPPRPVKEEEKKASKVVEIVSK